LPSTKTKEDVHHSKSWAVEDENDILVNRVVEDLIPYAITPSMLQSEINNATAQRGHRFYKTLQKLTW